MPLLCNMRRHDGATSSSRNVSCIGLTDARLPLHVRGIFSLKENPFGPQSDLSYKKTIQSVISYLQFMYAILAFPPLHRANIHDRFGGLRIMAYCYVGLFLITKCGQTEGNPISNCSVYILRHFIGPFPGVLSCMFSGQAKSSMKILQFLWGL